MLRLLLVSACLCVALVTSQSYYQYALPAPTDQYPIVYSRYPSVQYNSYPYNYQQQYYPSLYYSPYQQSYLQQPQQPSSFYYSGVTAQRPYPIAGGISDTTQPASAASDSFRQALQTTIRDQFIQQTGITPASFDLVSYKTQVVAGTNYFAKVSLGNNQMAHLRIYQPLPYTGQSMQLSSVQLNKSLTDAIDYF